MARWTVKEMVLKVLSTDEAILFLEALQKQIKTVDIIANYFPGRVQIRFEGTKEHLKEAVERAKQLLQIVRGALYPDADDFFDFDLTYLTQKTGKTFPVKTLINILLLKGYESYREEETIVSKVDLSSLIAIISALDATLASMPYEVSTSSLREVLATLAIIEELTVNEVISKAKKAKIVKEDDYQRLALSLAPNQAIRKFLDYSQNNRKK